MLSVRLMTYNHSKHIIECLKSIDQQKTSFNFEVVIGDDFSTDNNVELIKNFILSSSNKNITYVLLNRKKDDSYSLVRKQKGRLYNFVNILEHCKGQYIAFIDGDDYWNDSLKLQKQLDFLEANKNYSICFSKVNNVDENSQFLSSSNSDTPTLTNIHKLLEGNYIHTPSITVKKNALKIPPEDWFYKMPMGDWPMWINAAKHGEIKMINEPLASYRIHNQGIWGKKDELENLIKGTKALKLLIKNIEKQYHNPLLNKLILNLRYISNTYKTDKNWFKYLSYISKYYYFRFKLS